MVPWITVSWVKLGKDSFSDLIDGSFYLGHSVLTSYIKFSAFAIKESCYIIIAEIFWQPMLKEDQEV